MEETSPKPISLSDDDVVFACPKCGKSLAIDRKASGMVVQCTDCVSKIRVPEPPSREGIIADVRDVRIMELTEALEKSEAHVRKLELLLQEYRGRRSVLEGMRSENIKRYKLIEKEMSLVQSSLDRIGTYLRDATNEGQAD